MELKIIKNKKQYEQYLDWVDVQFNNKVKSNTPQGEKLQVALLLIKQYEDAIIATGKSKYPEKKSISINKYNFFLTFIKQLFYQTTTSSLFLDNDEKNEGSYKETRGRQNTETENDQQSDLQKERKQAKQCRLTVPIPYIPIPASD